MLYTVFGYDQTQSDDNDEKCSRRMALEYANKAMGVEWVLAQLKEARDELHSSDEYWNIPFWETPAVDEDYNWVSSGLLTRDKTVNVPAHIKRSFLYHFGYTKGVSDALTQMLEVAKPKFVMDALIILKNDTDVNEDIDFLTYLLNSNTMEDSEDSEDSDDRNDKASDEMDCECNHPQDLLGLQLSRMVI